MASDRTPHRFPRFESVEDDRRHRKQRLAAALRLFGKLGYDEGAAGHITVRDPERADHFWVNPLAMAFSDVRVKDLLLVDHNGEVVEGDWPVNRAAFVIHSAIHAARPDVDAAAHSHSIHGKAFSALRRPLDPLTQDACAFYGDHAVYADYGGVAFAEEEGKNIAAALGGCKAAILANHGLLTVGGTVDEAAWWFVTMDRSCRAQLLAEAAGTPVPIGPELAAQTAEQTGASRTGWISAQPLFDRIIKEQPDLLEE